MLDRRNFLAHAGATALAGVLPLAPMQAHAQANFPDHPIKLFVTFGPGSGPDTLARAIGPEIANQLGQSIVIDNRPAGGGNVAAQQLLQEKRDGYTLILATDSLFTMNPYLLPKTSFDLGSDFTLVAPIAEASVFLVVNPALNVNNVKELVALIKANPGKYTYFAPTGTPHHLLGERFTEINDLKWEHVSYRDPQQALTEMLSGLVPIGFASYAQVAGSVNAGKLKVLGVSTSSRLASHADVPALNEFYPGLEEAGWFAVYAPAGTPKPVIDKLAQAVTKARDSADVKQRLDQFGMRTVDADALSFAERVKAESLRRGELIRTRGVRMD
jgi:tripartite-type tricarboxylate transporter receptor subunit TctC